MYSFAPFYEGHNEAEKKLFLSINSPVKIYSKFGHEMVTNICSTNLSNPAIIAWSLATQADLGLGSWEWPSTTQMRKWNNREVSLVTCVFTIISARKSQIHLCFVQINFITENSYLLSLSGGRAISRTSTPFKLKGVLRTNLENLCKNQHKLSINYSLCFGLKSKIGSDKSEYKTYLVLYLGDKREFGDVNY